MVYLLSSVYNRVQNGINYTYEVAKQIFHKKENDPSQKFILEKINLIEKKIFIQMVDLSTHMNQVLHQIDVLSKKIEQIDNAQIYLREEMENIGRYRDIESITRCRNYVKKIQNTFLSMSVALRKRCDLHEPISLSTCSICITLLNTFKNNLIQIQSYLELATPYLHSFRSFEIRSQLLHMFATNSVLEAITNLSVFEETDQEKSCANVQKILNKFTKTFPKISNEIAEIHFHLDTSIREEQERRPSLQKLNIYLT